MKKAYQILILLFHCLIFISSSCSFFISNSSNSSCLPHQSSILLQLKTEFSPSTSFPYYGDWKVGSDCCSWHGVTCNKATGHVVGLDLSYSLHGPLLSNSSIFKLIHLQKLNLASNNFNSSPIPSEFGQLSRLTHLDLSYSGFSGRVPPEFSRLTNLISLDLSRNSDVETKQELELLKMLTQNMIFLRKLDLSGLNISSEVPESFLNLSSLTHLTLEDCGLIGEFPKAIFLLPNLQVIDLRNNEDLTGSLPEFQSGSNLTSLIVRHTKFAGELPISIGKLQSLDKLDLSSSMFSGSVPHSIGNLSQLSYLSLSSNFLSGQLPHSIGNLSQLSGLFLSHNFLGGQLPCTLRNLAKVSALYLDGNEFSGGFPSSLGNLPQLRYLNLGENKFSGRIPSLVENFTELIGLYLSDNFFQGSLPISFPHFLEDIRFQNNSLTGSIPSLAFNNLTFLEYLDLSTNSLHGVIPSSLLTLGSLQTLYLDYNEFISLETLSNSSLLEYLSLCGNRLKQFPSSFSKFFLLKTLVLSSNNLSGRFDMGTFSGIRLLSDLDLSYNSLSLATNKSTNVSALPKFLSLYLSSCNITEFPDFLKAQNLLNILDLSNNRIGGLIPIWFLSMNFGRLSLSHNSISGWEEVPLVLPWRSVHLDLSSNMLKGPLVVPSMSTLYFFISNNSLTGSIDSLFCGLRSLEVLDASSNRLGGTIPRCLDNLDGSLRVLNLRRNNFHGSIPHICRGKSELMTLDLSHNQLYGNLPRSLVKCKNLQVLNLGHNHLSEAFPFWLQDLQRLEVLVLSCNKFHGPIWYPRGFFGFMTLKTIDLSHNDFTGNFPSEYFRNWTSMSSKVSKMGFDPDDEKGTYNDSVKITFKGQEMEFVKTLTIFISIDLSNNKFDGEIPSTLWHLRSLVMLNLSSNNFRGFIPSSIGNLKELESLDLSNNKLFGKIPQQLAVLTFLAYLNFSNNQLEGPIPQGGQVSTFQDSSFEGNLGLCGLPLSIKCGAPFQAPDDDYNNEKSDSLFSFGWKVVAMGYGCGLLVGMGVGHVISSRRPDLISKVFRMRLYK